METLIYIWNFVIWVACALAVSWHIQDDATLKDHPKWVRITGGAFLGLISPIFVLAAIIYRLARMG